MENMENLNAILSEAHGFEEIPVNPKAKTLTAEEIAEMERRRKERAAMHAVADPKKVEPVPVDPAAKARRKGDLRFMGKALTGAAFGIGSFAAQAAGLMDTQLAIAVGGVALSWLTFWAGAWIQFRFCDGGLLDG